MNVFHQSAVSGLIATWCLLSLATVPASAQPMTPPSTINLSDPCKATLFDAEQRIEGYKRAYVPRTRLLYAEAGNIFAIAEPLNITFTLGAYDTVVQGDVVSQSSALDILASEQLLLALTSQIVESCPSIVSATFLLGEYQQRTFGLISSGDGPVEEFACVEDITSPLPWGYQYCLTRF